MSDDAYILKGGEREFQRLRVQAEAFTAEAATMLDRIGVPEAASCLDLGCGVGGIVDLLSTRVGPSGDVLGVDIDPDSIDAAKNWARQRGLENVRFDVADVFDNDLPADAFDLVHCRFVITTIGRGAEVVDAAGRLVKPGGVLCLEEVDGAGFGCYPPNAGVAALQQLLIDMFSVVGDPEAGWKCYGLMQQAGFEGVDFRPCSAGARAGDALTSYLVETANSIREAALQAGIITDKDLDDAIADASEHLARPDVISTMYTVFQVWGRKPLR
jgi:SAM-dependent methyltransferase